MHFLLRIGPESHTQHYSVLSSFFLCFAIPFIMNTDVYRKCQNGIVRLRSSTNWGSAMCLLTMLIYKVTRDRNFSFEYQYVTS